MSKMFQAYAARQKVDEADLHFMCYGERVLSDSTPAMLDLVDGDQLDVYPLQSGS